MMQNKPVSIVAALLLALGLSACDKPGPAEQAGKQIDQVASDADKKIGQAVNKMEKAISEQGEKTALSFDDTEITARIKAGLLAESSLESLQISVDTSRGAVTLSGSVDSMASSDKARNVAAVVDGVREVNNQLVVSPGK